MPSFSNMRNLTRLYLHKNKITELSDSLRLLRKLKVLNLGFNQIEFDKGGGGKEYEEEEEEEEEGEGLSSLEILVLEGNRMRRIPCWMVVSRNLTTVRVADNALDSPLPLSLATRCTSLSSLHCARNRIPGTLFPDLPSHSASSSSSSCCCLQNLKKLNVEDNLLTVAFLDQLFGKRGTEAEQSRGEMKSEAGNFRGMLSGSLEKLDFRGNPIEISGDDGRVRAWSSCFPNLHFDMESCCCIPKKERDV